MQEVLTARGGRPARGGGGGGGGAPGQAGGERGHKGRSAEAGAGGMQQLAHQVRLRLRPRQLPQLPQHLQPPGGGPAFIPAHSSTIAQADGLEQHTIAHLASHLGR